jgi:hypothetical protein
MINYFTPDDFQSLKKEKLPKNNLKQFGHTPSELSMKVIIGYSAAYQILKSKQLGDIEILNN